MEEFLFASININEDIVETFKSFNLTQRHWKLDACEI